MLPCARIFSYRTSSFTYGTGSNPSLASSPTRRSSDLGASEPRRLGHARAVDHALRVRDAGSVFHRARRDRKSTRLNSSHGYISYAVFCLKKKKDDAVKPHAMPRRALYQARTQNRHVII